MIEDGHNITVEAETVDTPATNIISTNSNAAVSGNFLSEPFEPLKQMEAKNNHEEAINGSNTSELFGSKTATPRQHEVRPVINPNNVRSTTSLSSNEILTVHRNQEPVLQKTLIDNNPLSIHASQSPRNKKSTTFFHSQKSQPVPNGFKGTVEDVIKTGNNSKTDTASTNINNANSVNTNNYTRVQTKLHTEKNTPTSESFNKSLLPLQKSVNSIRNLKNVPDNSSNNMLSIASESPGPIMLPIINQTQTNPQSNSGTIISQVSSLKTNEAKTSKILERPSMPSMNSREILLEDQRPTLQKRVTQTSAKNEEVPRVHDNDVSQPPTKTDFFAARLASAVGENEVSDSEETFVYESTANSIKNVKIGNSDQVNDGLDRTQNNKLHGLSSKMSVPLLNNGKTLVSQLKNQRHTSMGTFPTGNKFSINAGQGNNQYSKATSSINNLHDDIPSLKIATGQQKQQDIHSIKSYSSTQHSPTNKPSMPYIPNGVATSPTSRHKQKVAQSSNHSRKASVNKAAMRQNSVIRYRVPSSNVPNISNSESRRNLRTTASKIFDANGVPLRRYSGVPDHINLEDYIEQSDGQNAIYGSPTNNNMNDYELGKNGNHASFPVYKEDELSKDSNVIHEKNNDGSEERKNDKGQHTLSAEYTQPIDDDDQSMFYYNHGGVLEARPQISDYDEDLCSELEDNENDSGFYNTYQYYQDGPKNVKNGSKSDCCSFSGLNQPVSEYARRFASRENSSHINENTPLRAPQHYCTNESNYSPHNFSTKKSSWSKLKHCIYFTFVITILVTIGFILGFLLATNKELQGVEIAFIDNVISSTDELVFDITAAAFNPGFFTINVQDANIDIFARSSYTRSENVKKGNKDSSAETVLLGTVQQLESPLQFQGEFIRRHYDVSSSSIKLLDPGSEDAKKGPNIGDEKKSDGTSPGMSRSSKLSSAMHKSEINENSGDDDDDDLSDIDKWKKLLKHDYELIIKGSFKYKIPFFNTERSVSVQRNAQVHPNEGRDDDF